MSLAELRAGARGYPLRVWLVCLFAYALSQMDLALWGYALPEIRREFGLTRSGLGALTGAAFALGGVLLVWLGSLADRHGRRAMLQFGTVTSPLFVAAHALAPGTLALGALRALSIATGGLLYPATGALVAEEAPARLRGLYTGLLQIGYPLGWFFASVLAAWLIAGHGWRVLFLTGLVGIPYTWVIRRAIRESTRFSATDGAPHGRLDELFAAPYRRRVATLFVAQYCFVIAYGGAFLFAPLYFHERRGFDIAGTATLVGLSNLVGIVGYVAAAWIGEFYLTRRTTTVVWTLVGAALFIVFLYGTHGWLDSLVAFSAMAVFLLGTAAVKFAYIAELFPTRLRATGLAVCGSFAVALGQATGPLLIGRLADTRDWDFAMLIGVALPLALAGLLYLALRPLPSGLDVDEIERRLGTTP